MASPAARSETPQQLFEPHQPSAWGDLTLGSTDSQGYPRVTGSKRGGQDGELTEDLDVLSDRVERLAQQVKRVKTTAQAFVENSRMVEVLGGGFFRQNELQQIRCTSFVIRRLQDRPQEGLDWLERNPELLAKSAELIALKGSLFEKLKQPDEALRCYVQALAADPTNPEAQFGKWTIQKAQGKHPEAGKTLRHLRVALDDALDTDETDYEILESLFFPPVASQNGV